MFVSGEKPQDSVNIKNERLAKRLELKESTIKQELPTVGFLPFKASVCSSSAELLGTYSVQLSIETFSEA